VLGCSGHAERDRVSNQWKCTVSVVAAVSVGARIDKSDVIPQEDIVRSVEEFERRYPRLATSVAVDRARLDDDVVDGVSEFLRERDFESDALGLPALAVGLGLYLVRDLQVDEVVGSGDAFAGVMLPRLAAVVHAYAADTSG
jgi:hypothetical protein